MTGNFGFIFIYYGCERCVVKKKYSAIRHRATARQMLIDTRELHRSTSSSWPRAEHFSSSSRWLQLGVIGIYLLYHTREVDSLLTQMVYGVFANTSKLFSSNSKHSIRKRSLVRKCTSVERNEIWVYIANARVYRPVTNSK